MHTLNKIKVKPIAAESMGVRSMCTLVETQDVRVLLDPGISLAPYRLSLLPHPTEFQAIASLRQRIADAADGAEVITISHYHFDHHTPSYEDWLVNWTMNGETARQIYHNKRVIMKHPRENINPSQRHRAWMFQRTGGKHAKALEKADGKTFTFGGTKLRFSEAVAHGPDETALGWVVMATIDFDDERFMFAPDVQGPMSKRTLEIILTEKPQVLMVGGPPLYLSGTKVDAMQLQKALTNLQDVVKALPLTILEHHALRDAEWQSKTQLVYEVAASAGHKLMTAAEFAGEKNLFLESRRKELYSEHPPSDEFRKWMKLSASEISRVKPPIH